MKQLWYREPLHAASFVCVFARSLWSFHHPSFLFPPLSFCTPPTSPTHTHKHALTPKLATSCEGRLLAPTPELPRPGPPQMPQFQLTCKRPWMWRMHHTNRKSPAVYGQPANWMLPELPSRAVISHSRQFLTQHKIKCSSTSAWAQTGSLHTWHFYTRGIIGEKGLPRAEPRSQVFTNIKTHWLCFILFSYHSA